jgi:2-hydroxy-6-oxonona-2,4-dienedioate hydrolase/4,5:9,10-diseco-3-hydroxy-5,9,17-trioxoandrosta-1(10),2-diene-4-oate hydrolase
MYRVIVPDLPGFGRSYKTPHSGPLFAANADAIVGLLDNLKLGKAHVIGNSLGGGVALKMALEAPDRIGKLVLMGAAGLASAYSKIPSEGVRRIFQYYAGDGPSREKLEALLRLLVFDSSNLTDEVVEERYQTSVEPDILKDPPFGRGDRRPNLEELWRDERLASLPHDTLVMWGRDDSINPIYTAEILMSQIPNARMISFTRCGHWVQWEKADAFNRIVLSFLDEAAGQ